MTYDKQKLKTKALRYCSENKTSISRELGFGTQGVVYKTEHNTAIKVYNLNDTHDS